MIVAVLMGAVFMGAGMSFAGLALGSSPRRVNGALKLTAAACALLAIFDAISGNWRSAIPAAVAAWVWWKLSGGSQGKRKRRSLKSLGHKARLKLAELLERMPTLAPRLREVPT